MALSLRREQYLPLGRAFVSNLLKILLAVAGMSLWLYFASADISLWSQWTWSLRLIELLKLILPAILSYVLLLWIMGIRQHHLLR